MCVTRANTNSITMAWNSVRRSYYGIARDYFNPNRNQTRLRRMYLYDWIPCLYTFRFGFVSMLLYHGSVYNIDRWDPILSYLWRHSDKFDAFVPMLPVVLEVIHLPRFDWKQRLIHLCILVFQLLLLLQSLPSRCESIGLAVVVRTTSAESRWIWQV